MIDNAKLGNARPTVLVVDDTPENLMVLSGVLGESYTVRAVNSGARALEAVKVAPFPDIILLDVMMPQMDGYECLRRLREDAELRNIPVIFVTSLDSPEDERLGLDLGAVDYITKPVNPAIVEARVRNHLELKLAHDWMLEQNRFLAAELQRLLEILAHHLQEPVRQQVIYSQILRRTLEIALSPPAENSLKHIMGGAMHLRAMLRDILHYLSIPCADPPVRPCHTDVVVAREYRMMAKAIANIGGAVAISPLPDVWINDGHLGDLMHVLLQNALDNFSPDRPLHVSISAVPTDSGALFSVVDNGCGIPVESRDRVFLIFDRLDRGSERERTGMGLALAKKIIDTAGGKIWIEDGVEGGTCVRFSIPAEQPPAR